MQTSIYLVLALAISCATACDSPPCTSLNNYASFRFTNGTETCCRLCESGFRCDGRVRVACNTTIGEYQSSYGQNRCMVSAPCIEGLWESSPVLSTSPRVCSIPKQCDSVSQIETAAPTISTDRGCGCKDGWTGSTQCHKCSSIIPGCTKCSQNYSEILCNECSTGYNIGNLPQKNSTCILCQIKDCEICSGENICQTCSDSKRVVNNACVCRDPNCDVCRTNCSACKTPYRFDINGNCTLCVTTHSLVNGTCVFRTTREPAISTSASTNATETNSASSKNKSASGTPVYASVAISVTIAIVCLIISIATYKYVAGRRIASAMALKNENRHILINSVPAVLPEFREAPRMNITYLSSANNGIPPGFRETPQGNSGYLTPVKSPAGAGDEVIYESADSADISGFPLYDIATTDGYLATGADADNSDEDEDVI